MAIPTERASAIPLIDRFQVVGFRASGEAILRTLPCSCSIFFSVRKLEYPIELLSQHMVLGINQEGVHFFCPRPKKYILSVKLEDIKKFGFKHTALGFQMQISGGLHNFKFVTKQAKEICEALQMCIQECQRNTNQLLRETDDKQKQEELERLQKDIMEIMSDSDRIKLLCEEKDAALKASLLDKEILKLNMAMLSNLSLENKKNMAGTVNELKDLYEESNAVLKLQVSCLEKKLAVSESRLASRNADCSTMRNKLKELEELREMKEDIHRKNEKVAIMLEMKQTEFAELEALYKNEQVLRERYSNTIEEMKAQRQG
ncbi:hypothetical protein PTKIN_Ptkin18bG0155500 [Pterospermum kingtungense]